MTSLSITFAWYDYVLFVAVLLSSVFIGIYFGFFGKKQTSADEYLFGGRQMTAAPIALSLIASHISGIMILAIPTDIYQFGATYWFAAISIMVGSIMCVHLYIPVYHNLGLSSIYKYLELRFDSRLRIISSLLYLVKTLCYLPVVMYLPALSLAQATGWNLKIITPILCGICIFYTSIGGFKTVVWTDTLQLVIMIAALIAVVVLGVIDVGGLGVVFTRAYESHRLDISFSFNPTVRDTFWSILIGYFFVGTSLLAINQGHVQKFIALPNLKTTKKSTYLFAIGNLLAFTIVVLIGLILNAKYYKCDPITSHIIVKADQILPYFIMEMGSSIPGLSGLFISGVFCASLSTLSSHLNSLSGIIYDDFMSRCISKQISPKSVSIILKVLVICVGIFCTSLVFIVEHLGSALALAISLLSMGAGPLMGMFTLGMFFPVANANGALFGAIISFITSLSMTIGTQYYIFIGALHPVTKPLFTEGCDFINGTLISLTQINDQDRILVPWMFRISHYYTCMIGIFTTLTSGLIISYLTRDKRAKQVDLKLLSPAIHWLMRTKGENYEIVTQRPLQD